MADRGRIEKLLGMLGSTFDGERANAARMIAGMAERDGVTIVELVYDARPQAHRATAAPERKTSSARRARTTMIVDALKDIAASEGELEFVVTAWEYQFAVDVSERHEVDYELSEKQVGCAQRIIDKVQRARAARNGAPA